MSQSFPTNESANHPTNPKCTRHEYPSISLTLAAGPMNPPRLPPIADGRAVAYETSTKKCLVHLGGWNLVRNAPEQSLHEMDLTTRVWTEVKDIPMGARSGHIMNFSKATGTVLIHGGCGSSSSSSGPSCLRDLWSLQWTTESNHVIGWVWKCLDDGTLLCRDAPTPCARCGHSGAVAEDRMYLFGGFDGSQRLNDLWSWDITENTSAVPTEPSTASNRGWKNLRCTGTLPSPRDDAALCAVPNSTTGSPTLVLHGGFTEFGPSGELYLWYAETGIWTQVTAFQSGLAPGSIYKHTLIAIPPLTRDNISTPNPAPTGGSKPGNAPPPASSDSGHCGPSISTPSPPNIWLLGGRPSEHGTSPCSRPLSVTERTTIPMYSLASFRWSNLNVDGDALRIFVNGCVVFVEQDRRIWVLGGYDPEDFAPLYIPSIREIEVERVPETIVAKGAKK